MRNGDKSNNIGMTQSEEMMEHPANSSSGTLDRQLMLLYLEKLHIFEKAEPQLFEEAGIEALEAEIDAAMEELRSLPRTPVLEMLTTLLTDPEREIRCDAVEAILRLGDPIGIDLVLPLLKDHDNVVRECVCGLLHEFGDERASAPLTELLLHDKDVNVRGLAAFALGAVGDRQAIDGLSWAQHHDRGIDRQGHSVRQAAMEAIKTILTRQ